MSNPFMASGTPGANIEEARGLDMSTRWPFSGNKGVTHIRKAMKETIPTIVHLRAVVQFMGLVRSYSGFSSWDEPESVWAAIFSSLTFCP
jgi:hypothetical protein